MVDILTFATPNCFLISLAYVQMWWWWWGLVSQRWYKYSWEAKEFSFKVVHSERLDIDHLMWNSYFRKWCCYNFCDFEQQWNSINWKTRRLFFNLTNTADLPHVECIARLHNCCWSETNAAWKILIARDISQQKVHRFNMKFFLEERRWLLVFQKFYQENFNKVSS